jgi:isopentenyl-diphosphate delta-isomerase
MAEMLVLVDENDREIGTEEKLAAHQAGKLHRAFSIYIFNSRGQLLLTRRAPGKYHSPGLWTNTCCGHPRPGEELSAAARRRLREETGIVCDIQHGYHFIYRVGFENGLTEHELDHVFVGAYDGPLDVDPAEADAVEWVEVEALLRDVEANPARFTVWMALSLKGAVDYWRGLEARRPKR